MNAPSRSVSRRYWVPVTKGDAVLRAIVSAAVVLVFGWLLGLDVAVLLACTSVSGLGLLLADLDRVHKREKSSGRPT